MSITPTRKKSVFQLVADIPRLLIELIKEELADGSKVKVDENYIRESIENPEAKKVKGFETMVMPPFKGLLTEEEMNAMVAYIKSLQ